MTPLYGYQQAVLPAIAAGEPVYLGFDPGLGKSRTALEAAKARGAKRILVIAPASGRYVWEREVRQWWPEMPFHIARGPADFASFSKNGITLVTYGLLSRKDSSYVSVIAKSQHGFDMTVLDEAAAVKNSGANRTKAILGKMLPRLGYLLPMSGTPAPNHAGELFPILRAVFPQAIHKGSGASMTEYEFQEAFCHVTSKRFGTGPSIRVIEGSRNVSELRRRMDGFMRRVKKTDVLKDLPPIRWDVVPVAPSAIYTAGITAVPDPTMTDDELLKWLSGASGEHVMHLRRMLGLAKVEAAVEYLDDFLANAAPDQKILVFAHHKEVIENLINGLLEHNPVAVTGSTSPALRTQAIDRFLTADNCRVFIGNIQAAGTAITLVGPNCKCSDVFFVEASYSVGDNVQAACRVHRIGQHDGVVARFLTAHGTIDDRIQDILARKASDFDQLFN